ncbi:hypothetical protein C8R43DRAFT_955203 [Mycena crocata]|nr:hypothetical protein C8R43DRAFT_955203 [Mycena crocata]
MPSQPALNARTATVNDSDDPYEVHLQITGVPALPPSSFDRKSLTFIVHAPRRSHLNARETAYSNHQRSVPRKRQEYMMRRGPNPFHPSALGSSVVIGRTQADDLANLSIGIRQAGTRTSHPVVDGYRGLCSQCQRANIDGGWGIYQQIGEQNEGRPRTFRSAASCLRKDAQRLGSACSGFHTFHEASDGCAYRLAKAVSKTEQVLRSEGNAVTGIPGSIGALGSNCHSFPLKIVAFGLQVQK